MKTPYISTVIVGRNDNYGENFIERLSLFIRHLDRQLSRNRNLMEVVLVEYNPIQENAPLREVIPKTTNLTVRIITVPAELHATTGRSAPVLEWYGKNVGIRRSRGDFILITNPDIIFTDELIKYFSRKVLSTDTLYRTDRYDYDGTGIDSVTLTDTVSFAVSRTFQVHKCPETVPTSGPDIYALDKSDYQTPIPFTNASGDFILSAKENFLRAQGVCWENDVTQGHTDSFSVFRLFIKNQLKQEVLVAPFCIFHMDHSRKPNQIPWIPQMAKLAVGWPSMYTENWGFGDTDLIEWSNNKGAS